MTSAYRMWYLAASTVAAPTADSVHVMRMCDALSELTKEVVLFAKAGDCSDLAAYYGLRSRLATELTDFSSRLDLLRYLARLRRVPAPDLVFGRYVYPLAYLAARNLPCMYEVHTPAGGIKRQVERWLFGRAQLIGVVFITEALRDHYLDEYPALAGRHLVLADAADDPGDALPPQTAQPLTVGYVGSWYAGRGIELIVSLAEQLPSLQFRLAGGSAEDLRQLGLAATPNITCLGYLPPAAVPGELRRADVLLAPYARVIRMPGDTGDSSRWCSPMKIFEYMAQGKAIVCADLPVLREVLKHDANCLLLEPENVERWRATLQRLDGDRGLARRLGAQARADFLARHTWNQRAGAVLAYARQKQLPPGASSS